MLSRKSAVIIFALKTVWRKHLQYVVSSISPAELGPVTNKAPVYPRSNNWDILQTSVACGYWSHFGEKCTCTNIGPVRFPLITTIQNNRTRLFTYQVETGWWSSTSPCYLPTRQETCVERLASIDQGRGNAVKMTNQTSDNCIRVGMFAGQTNRVSNMAIIHLAFVQCTLTGAFVKYVSHGNAAVAVTRVASRRKPFSAPF